MAQTDEDKHPEGTGENTFVLGGPVGNPLVQLSQEMDSSPKLGPPSPLCVSRRTLGEAWLLRSCRPSAAGCSNPTGLPLEQTA